MLERKVYLRTRVLQKRKNHNKEHRMLMEMKERSWRIGPGGRVPGSLPRAGVEPQNPGKGGSLSPQAMEGNTSGETLILWSPNPLTLMSYMVTSLRRRAQQRRGDKEEKQGDKELIARSRTERKMTAWPRCGMG